MPIDIQQFACLADNYGFLIHDRDTGLTASVDTPDYQAINQNLDKLGWRLTHILNTHHHFDHTGGNQALKEKWNCEVIGPAREAQRIPCIDRPVGDGDVVELGASKALVLETPGHTIGHIVYHFADDNAAFVGDTVFAMGCGRLFEGSADQMHHSLSKIAALPPSTDLYCAHEYTQANAAFALSVDPHNAELKSRATEVDRLRMDDQPTVPTTVAAELATNPFLRTWHASLKQAAGPSADDAVEVFAAIRRLKDGFKG